MWFTMVMICLPYVFLKQVCCRQTDYWQFVKDIRWLSPHSALHVEKVSKGIHKASLFDVLYAESPRLEVWHMARRGNYPCQIDLERRML